MNHDTVTPKGWVKLELRDSNGRLKQTQIANTVTATGKNGIADQILLSPTLNKPTHMAVGTGSPAANALGTETSRLVLLTKTRATNVITMTCTWGAGVGTAALTEAGVFDASSSGNMWLSTSFSVINKGANDTLAVTWTLTIA